MNFERLKLLRCAARVKRWHTMPPLYPQSVGEHTFNVLALAIEVIAPRRMSPQLMQAILYHDVPEAITGDVPGPTLRRSLALGRAMEEAEDSVRARFTIKQPDLDPWEDQVLRFCDRMEVVIFAYEEVTMGNMLMVSRGRSTLSGLEATGLHKVTPVAEGLWRLMHGRFVAIGDSVLAEDALHGWQG